MYPPPTGSALVLHSQSMKIAVKVYAGGLKLKHCSYTCIALFSLALVIVSLINMNNWPYIGINNFQLMHQIRTLA